MSTFALLKGMRGVLASDGSDWSDLSDGLDGSVRGRWGVKNPYY